MSIKKTQETVPIKPAWDINDQLVRQRLRQFQNELALIVKDDPETAGDEVNFFCLKKGYWPKWITDSSYFRIDRRQYGKIWKKRIECTTTNPAIEGVREMHQALQKLLDRERYAKKKEHEEILAGQECMGKPGTANRCLICYPKTYKEIMDDIGYVMPTRSSLARSMAMPKAAAPVPIIKIEKPEPVDLVADEFKDNNFCEKCGETKARCECIREQDLPF